MRSYPLITKILLFVLVVIFIANHLGALPYTIAYPGVYSVGTFLAHFSHVSLFHLVSNVIGIIIVSPPLEQGLGKTKYLSLLVFLWLAQVYLLPQLTPSPVLGFSGILLGLLTFLAFRLWVRTRHLPHFTLGRDLLVLVGLNVVLPLFVPQISFVGHALGAALGIVAYGVEVLAERK